MYLAYALRQASIPLVFYAFRELLFITYCAFSTRAPGLIAKVRLS